MSRSGYSDDCDSGALNCWRQAVNRAITGSRGQALLREMLAALDAMSAKELVAHELEADGAHCALGVVGANRGYALSAVDPEDYNRVAKLFDIAPAMAREIVFMNDEVEKFHRDDEGKWRRETPAERWVRMREWVANQIKESA